MELNLSLVEATPSTVAAEAAAAGCSSTVAGGGFAGYWHGMCQRFSPGAIYMLIVLNSCSAISFGAVGLILPYYLKRDMALEPSEATYWGSMLSVCWALKPLMGMWTEAFPVRGLRFKPYLVLSSTLTVVGLLVLGLCPPSDTAALTGLMLFSFSTAWSDLLGNAWIVTVARRDPSAEAAADLNAFAAGVYGLVGTFGVLLGGGLYSLFADARLCYCILAGQHSLQIAAAYRPGWIFEPTVQKQAGCGVMPVIKKTWDAVKPSGPSKGVILRCVAFFALSTAIVPDMSQSIFAFYIDDDTPGSFASTIGNLTLVHEQIFARTDIDCAWARVHQLQEANASCLSDEPAFEIAVQDFETGNHVKLWNLAPSYCPATCGQCSVTRRGCLRFSPGFITFISMLSTFTGFVAAIVYSQYLANLPMRTQFFWLMLLSPLTGFCDVILAMRWNIAVGINDHWFAGVDTVMQDMVTNLQLLAVYTLVTDICPESIEATLFSWVMGAIFMAGTMSSVFGGMLTEALDVTSADYSHLWLLCAVRVALCTFTVGLIFLVPTEAVIKTVTRKHEHGGAASDNII